MIIAVTKAKDLLEGGTGTSIGGLRGIEVLSVPFASLRNCYAGETYVTLCLINIITLMWISRVLSMKL